MNFLYSFEKIQKDEYSIVLDLWSVLPDPGECNDPEECCRWEGQLTSNIEGALEEAGYYIDGDAIGFDDDTKEKIKDRIKKDLEDYRKLKRSRK